MARLAPEALDHLRDLPAQQMYETVRGLVYQAEGGSGDYLELMEELVEQGLLTAEEIEAFEDAGAR